MNAASPPPTQPAVLISEVGPRDGLHRVARSMATADRQARITALHTANLPPGFHHADGRTPATSRQRDGGAGVHA